MIMMLSLWSLIVTAIRRFDGCLVIVEARERFLDTQIIMPSLALSKTWVLPGFFAWRTIFALWKEASE